jgi:hypothetical protein
MPLNLLKSSSLGHSHLFREDLQWEDCSPSRSSHRSLAGFASLQEKTLSMKPSGYVQFFQVMVTTIQLLCLYNISRVTRKVV